jgi:transcription initiation factor TFIID subunit 2
MYQTQGELNDDFEQIVINCKLFNPPATLPVVHAEALQRIWRSEVAKAVKLSYQEKRALQGMMNRLRTKPRYALALDASLPSY